METATEYRRIEVCEVGDVTVVRFRDQKIIDDVDIQDMGRELFELIEELSVNRLLVNFSGVEFFASSALGKMITLDKKVKKGKGIVLKLCGIRPELYEVFAITKLNRLFDIKRDERDALAAF